MATRASFALAVIAAGAAAVLALWWHSTRGIIGAGGFLTAVGEGLGLLAERDAYVRGPPGMATAATTALATAGVARRRIHAESFEF